MALCCIIPIVAIVALFYANVDSTYLYFLLVLLCPLMHFLLMFTRRRKRSYVSPKSVTTLRKAVDLHENIDELRGLHYLSIHEYLLLTASTIEWGGIIPSSHIIP